MNNNFNMGKILPYIQSSLTILVFLIPILHCSQTKAYPESLSLTLDAGKEYTLELDYLAEPVGFMVSPISNGDGKPISGNLIINGSPLILNDLSGFLRNLTKNAKNQTEAAILVIRFFAEKVVNGAEPWLCNMASKNFYNNLNNIYSNPSIVIGNYPYGASHTQARILAGLMNAAGFDARVLVIRKPPPDDPESWYHEITEIKIDHKWMAIDAYNSGFFF